MDKEHEKSILSLGNKSRLFVYNCTSKSVPSPSRVYDKGDARHKHYVLGLFLLFLPLLVQANILKKNKKNSREVWSGLRTQKKKWARKLEESEAHNLSEDS